MTAAARHPGIADRDREGQVLAEQDVVARAAGPSVNRLPVVLDRLPTGGLRITCPDLPGSLAAWLLVDALAVYRGTRLLTRDSLPLFAHPRDAVVRRWGATQPSATS